MSIDEPECGGQVRPYGVRRAATIKRHRVAVLGSGNIGCWVGGHIATGAVAEASTVKFLHRSSPTGRPK